MHLNDFFKSPYKIATYLIFTVLIATYWAQIITSIVWFVRIFWFITTKGSPFTVGFLLLFICGYSWFLFIILIVDMCIFGCCRNNCYQNLDYPVKYITHFTIWGVFSFVNVICGFILSSYGLTNGTKCADYVFKGICEYDDDDDYYGYSFNKLEKPKYYDDSGIVSAFCGKDYSYDYEDWKITAIEHIYDNPSYFCKSVGVPTFLWSFFHLLAMLALIGLLIWIKMTVKDEDSAAEDPNQVKQIENANANLNYQGYSPNQGYPPYQGYLPNPPYPPNQPYQPYQGYPPSQPYPQYQGYLPNQENYPQQGYQLVQENKSTQENVNLQINSPTTEEKVDKENQQTQESHHTNNIDTNHDDTIEKEN